MKAFETPFVEVKKFNLMDVLTASGAAASEATQATEATTETEEEPPPLGINIGYCI